MDTLTFSRLQELSQAVEPYAKYWPEWTQSSHCFLGKKHIRAAELFLLLHSYSRVARRMNTNSVEVIYTLIACISRLKLFRRIYEDWVEERKTKIIVLPRAPSSLQQSHDNINPRLSDVPIKSKSRETMTTGSFQTTFINNL